MTSQSDKSSSRLLLFGDSLGCPSLLRCIPRDKIVGLVAAESRPGSIEPVTKLAKEYQIPFLIQPAFSNKESYSQFIKAARELKPDLFVVYSYAMLLREDLLSIPRNGGVNIHGGTLPEYRGSNPIQWEIINREEEAGISIHRLTKELDSGDILESKSVSIGFSDTWIDVLNKISAMAENILQNQIDKIIQGTAIAEKQDSSRAIKRKRRKPDDGQFDWHMPAIDIYNLIRALVNPLPGAFTVFPDGSRELFPNFLSISAILERKSELIPLQLTTTHYLYPIVCQSPMSGIYFEIKDDTGKEFGSAVVSKITKTSAHVVIGDNFKEEFSAFCKNEFLVSKVIYS